MENVRMFVGGGGLEDGELSSDLIEEKLNLINDFQDNMEMQNSFTNENEKLLVQKLYTKLKVLPPITFIIDDELEETGKN